MKKAAFTLMLMLVCMAGIAKELDYYVIATGEKLYCTKIRLGAMNTTAVLENGEKVTLRTADIHSYRLNGKIFDKMPLYENNKFANKNIFMQFVTTRAGLKLYKYTLSEEGLDIKSGFYLKSTSVDHYVVFKGDKYFVSITDKNYPTMFDFFGMKYREI
jgi:hypothetical protein